LPERVRFEHRPSRESLGAADCAIAELPDARKTQAMMVGIALFTIFENNVVIIQRPPQGLAEFLYSVSQQSVENTAVID
jgi:hypothetical protein